MRKTICIAVLCVTAMLTGCNAVRGLGTLTSGLGKDLDQIGQAVNDGLNAPALPGYQPPPSGGGLFAR